MNNPELIPQPFYIDDDEREVADASFMLTAWLTALAFSFGCWGLIIWGTIRLMRGGL